MKEGLILESIKPEKLTNNELLQIAEVEKDMWAYGIGEYVKCNNCGLIHSKNDIFGHLSNDIKKESVTRLEEIISGDFIPCNRCEGDTDFIYDIETNIIDIKKRLFDTKASFMSILRSDINGNIEGFMDGYIDELINIYEMEFSSHYNKIGYEEIKKYFLNELNYLDFNKLLTISSLGTTEKYINFNNLLDLIRNFLFSIPKDYEDYTGIAEFDTGSNIHSFFHAMGFQKIDLKSYDLVDNKSLNYNSGLYYWPEMTKRYKEGFSVPIKEFIKLYGKKMKEVLIV